jgi:hypothetical protein
MSAWQSGATTCCTRTSNATELRLLDGVAQFQREPATPNSRVQSRMHSLKLNHAKALFHILREDVTQFLRGGAFEFSTTDEDGKRVWRVHQKKPTPNWSCLVGDIVHNLRASLDHLACKLVSANGGTLTHQIYFPIADTEAKFNQRISRDLAGASPEAVANVCALKPFAGGNERLYHVHALDIIDKHRDILVVSACAGQVTCGGQVTLPSGRVIEMPQLTINPAEYVLPIRDGEVVFSCVLGSDGTIDGPRNRFSFPVFAAFTDEPMRGQNILDALGAMGGATQSAWAALAPHVTV